jgi:hypothetical protein
MLCVLLNYLFLSHPKVESCKSELVLWENVFGRLGIHWCQHIRSKGSNSILSYSVSFYQQFTMLLIPYLCFVF